MVRDHTESPYIVGQRRTDEQARERQDAISSSLAELWQLPADRLPPLWMMQTIGSHSREHFLQTAAWLFPELIRRGRLRAESTVIDIGSGCGRLALPFSFFLSAGRFFGTDIFEAGLEWCTDHITATNPHITFHGQPKATRYYMGDAVAPSEGLSLGFAERDSVDLVYAISVFTHLVADDAAQYLAEVARVLKPDGIGYITTFIIDDDFSAYVRRSGRHAAVTELENGYYQAYEGQDFFAGYRMHRWQAMCSDAGLRIVGFDPGTWAEKPGSLHYQDVVLVRKSR